MRIHVFECMLVTAVVGLGLGIGELVYRGFDGPFTSPGRFRYTGPVQVALFRINTRMQPVLFGLEIAAGVAIWVNAMTGRGPRTWGVGRWAASSSGICALVYLGRADLISAINRYRFAGGPMEPRFWPHTNFLLFRFWNDYLAIALFGFGVSALLARWPKATQPDALEWLGRLLMVVIPLISIMFDLIPVIGP
ncbi:MAG: hypothetical protein JWN86_813 [Planctomycetota bacterium]|nr:hypothetical protein [Planctomycetota bacterium]